MQTGLGDDVNLDGGVTARVVNRARVDLGDGHCERGMSLLIGNASIS